MKLAYDQGRITLTAENVKENAALTQFLFAEKTQSEPVLAVPERKRRRRLTYTVLTDDEISIVKRELDQVKMNRVPSHKLASNRFVGRVIAPTVRALAKRFNCSRVTIVRKYREAQKPTTGIKINGQYL
jgi:hypothetical protein